MAVTVDGSGLPAELYDRLVDARVEQSTLVPDRFTLRFTDPDFSLFDEERFTLGAAVDIAFDAGAGAGEQVVTRGEVTALSVEQAATGRHELVVEGLDRAHRLARHTQVRSFRNQNDSDVASVIAREHGLATDIDSTNVMYPYLVQTGSDWVFLTEAAHRAGCQWWVTDKKLYFKTRPDGGSGPTLRWGDDLTRFKVRFSMGGMGEAVDVYGWDPDNQQAIAGTPARIDKASGNGAAVASTAPAASDLLDAATDSGAFVGTRSLRDVPVQDADEAAAVAVSLARLVSADHVRVRAETAGNPELRAGIEVTLEGLGAKLSGAYRVASVEHVVGGHEPYVTRFTCGGRHGASLVDLLHSPHPGGRWGSVGFAVGVVTNNKDPENAGRVKVKFPTLGDRDESDWARLVAAGAGPERGWLVLPEVDDEVVVGFEHGDVRRPFVVGGVWSKKHAPPVTADDAVDAEGKVTQRVFKTRAGHVVELVDSDKPSDTRVTIALSDNKTRLSLAGNEVTLATPNPIRVTTDQSLSLKATGDVAIEGANVKIKATATASVEGTQVEAKGTTTTKVSGAQTEVSGTASVKVQTTGVAQVKGSMLQLN